MFKLKDKRAFSLVEIMVVSVVFLVITAAILSIYMAGTDIGEITRYQNDLQAQSRNAMSTIVSEIRNATRTSTRLPSPNISIPASPDNYDITFYLPSDIDENGYITDSDGDIEWDTSDPITYQYSAEQKKLSRFEGGEEVVLAQDVSSVQFIDFDIDSTLFLDELRIILTLTKTTPKQRDITVTATAMVNLRN